MSLQLQSQKLELNRLGTYRRARSKSSHNFIEKKNDITVFIIMTLDLLHNYYKGVFFFTH